MAGGKGGAVQLPRRDVHRQAQAAAGCGAARRRPAGRRCARTHSPSGTMRPVSSARGMNSRGGTKPRWGCCQRTSASAPDDLAAAQIDLRLVGIVPRDEFGLPESMELLDGLSDGDVLARYDRVANASSSFQRDGLRFWRTEWEYRRQREVARRQEEAARRQEEAAKTMGRLTWAIFAFTLLVAVFTVLLYVHPLT